MEVLTVALVRVPSPFAQCVALLNAAVVGDGGRKRLKPTPGVAELEQIVEGQEEALSAADVLSGRRPMTYQI